MNMKTAISILITALLLAACGNKGPLVMPPKPEPAVPQDTAPAPAVPADKDDDGGR